MESNSLLLLQERRVYFVRDLLFLLQERCVQSVSCSLPAPPCSHTISLASQRNYICDLGCYIQPEPVQIQRNVGKFVIKIESKMRSLLKFLQVIVVCYIEIIRQ